MQSNTKECEVHTMADGDKKVKNAGQWFIVLIVGFVFAGFLSSLASASGLIFLQWLDYGSTFGTSGPCTLDLGVLCFSFEITIRITVGSIIGCVTALLLYHRFIG